MPTPNVESGTSTEFTFDTSIYRLTAIQKAAYRFTGSYSVEVNRVNENVVRVKLTSRPDSSPNVEAHALPNEVLDQELRETVAEETRTVRELLLAQAFSHLPLTDPIGENSDYRDDPLKIADVQRASH
jgi:His-Xaa-Ser system protein HxsD